MRPFEASAFASSVTLPVGLSQTQMLLDAAADAVVLHRRCLAGDGERERGHDRARAEDDAEELQQRAAEVVLDVADAVDDGFEDEHGFSVGSSQLAVGSEHGSESAGSPANCELRTADSVILSSPVDDHSVDDRDPALRARGDGGIVRDEDDGLAAGGQLFEDADDVAAGLLVEVAGRLVGQDQRRVVDERAGDGHALALAAGELVRAMLGAVVEADAIERFERARAALVAVDAGVEQRQLDVLPGSWRAAGG